jgi:ABC-type nitrate/sulfonate/bicarbonate transport system substrate-binding protein
MEHGFYSRHEVSLTEREFTNTADAVSAVHRGECDFLPTVSLADIARAALGLDRPDLLVLSHSRIPTQLTFDRITYMEGTELETLRHVSTKVGIGRSQTARLFVKWFLRERGFNLSDEQLIEFGSPAQLLANLSQGEVKFAHLYEPYCTMAEAKGLRFMQGSPFSAISLRAAPLGCSAISWELFNREPEVAAQLAAAWDDAIEWIDGNEEGAYRLLAEKMRGSVTAEECKLIVRSHERWIDMTTSRGTSEGTMARYIDRLREIDVVVGEGELPRLSYHHWAEDVV